MFKKNFHSKYLSKKNKYCFKKVQIANNKADLFQRNSQFFITQR